MPLCGCVPLPVYIIYVMVVAQVEVKMLGVGVEVVDHTCSERKEVMGELPEEEVLVVTENGIPVVA